MRILQLCSKVPYPALDGGCLAMLNMAMMLVDGGYTVKTMAIATTKHPIPKAGFPPELKNKIAIAAYEINTKPNFLKGLKVIFGSNQSYVYSRFFDKQFNKKLASILTDFKPDIVLLESAIMFNYFETIRDFSKTVKIIYRSHNIENSIWKLLAHETNSPLKKIYFNLESKRIANLELLINKKVDAIIAITKEDESEYKKQQFLKPLIVIPFTLNEKKYSLQPFIKEKTILHIGAMDYQPNIEGMRWFIKNVWSSLIAKHREAKFFIAGKSMPTNIAEFYGNGIDNKGEVVSASNFFMFSSIAVVPLWSGAGLKVKIIEAMALGKTVITTPHGFKGTEATPNTNILVAANPQEFCELVLRCWDNPAFCEQIGKNARVFIENNFTTESKIVALQSFINHIN
jgi:glycosyltransferase involved in cell wall biosynthesis